MPFSKVICLTFFSGSCFFFGTCALFAYFPGESIGVRMFAQLSDRFGAVETGVGTIIVGLIMTVWILLSRPGDANDVDFGCESEGDGGD